MWLWIVHPCYSCYSLAQLKKSRYSLETILLLIFRFIHKLLDNLTRFFLKYHDNQIYAYKLQLLHLIGIFKFIFFSSFESSKLSNPNLFFFFLKKLFQNCIMNDKIYIFIYRLLPFHKLSFLKYQVTKLTHSIYSIIYQ